MIEAIHKGWLLRGFWRKTVELCRRHPVLWLPVIAAAILSSFWREAGSAMARNIATSSAISISSAGGSSVLDGSHANSFSAPRWLIYLPVPACALADACCYIIAMLVTAKLLGRLLAEPGHATPYEGIAKTTPKGHAFLLGILAYLLSTGMFVLVFVPVTSLATSINRPALLTSPYLSGVCIIPMFLALGYFLTPMALRLLARSTGTLITTDKIALGRKSSVLAGFAITLLSVVLLVAGRSFHSTPAQKIAYGVASTIISALPYTLLFVAFSLLSMKHEDEQPFDVALSGEEQQEGA